MTKGDGRSAFRRFAAAIRVVCWIVGLFPRSLREFVWSASSPFEGRLAILLRYAILKSECQSLGDNVYIGRGVVIRHSERLRMGKNVSVHAGCYIEAAGGCTIGDDVSIAHMSSVLTTEHTWEDQSRPIKYNPIATASVTISDDVWIGCGVRILSGVSIGRRAVVAAGAVVTGPVQGNTVVAGVPARLVKTTQSDAPR